MRYKWYLKLFDKTKEMRDYFWLGWFYLKWIYYLKYLANISMDPINEILEIFFEFKQRNFYLNKCKI